MTHLTKEETDEMMDRCADVIAPMLPELAKRDNTFIAYALGLMIGTFYTTRLNERSRPHYKSLIEEAVQHVLDTRREQLRSMQ